MDTGGKDVVTDVTVESHVIKLMVSAHQDPHVTVVIEVEPASSGVLMVIGVMDV